MDFRLDLDLTDVPAADPPAPQDVFTWGDSPPPTAETLVPIPTHAARPAAQPVPAGRRLINTGPSERGAHRLESMLKCPQLYAYSYLLARQRGDGAVVEAFGASEPLVRGTMLHVGLAHHYARIRAAQRGENPEEFYEPHDAIEAAIDTMNRAEQRTAEGLRARVHGVIDKYVAHYGEERQEIVEVEQPVEATIGGHRVTQRWDLVTKDLAGRYWITDHKGAAKIESKTFRRYTLSIQFLVMHTIGALTFREKFGGIRINVVSFEGAPERYRFARASPEPAPFALSRLPRTIADAEGLIKFYENFDPWEYTRVFSEQVCLGPYGPCPGMELCRWGPNAPIAP
jgi:hypothetical protein